MTDIVERLNSNAQLVVCPFDKLSPEYWTTPNDKPCKFCGGEPEGPDKCTGADLRIMKEAADEITRLRTALATAEAEIERLTEKAIVGEYMWTPEELGEAVAATRKEALEEAARYHDDLSDQHEASAIDPDSKAQGHHAKQMIAHVKYATAIRALAENTGGDKP